MTDLEKLLIAALGKCGRAFTPADVASALHDLARELQRTGQVATLAALREALGDSTAVRL